MRFSWIKARGVVAVSAAALALQGVPAVAQFVPYMASPTQGTNRYQAHTAQQPQPTQQPQYTAMAFQGSGTRGATPTLNQPVEAVAPGLAVQSAPMQSYSAAPAAGCNCQASPSPAVSYAQPAPVVNYSQPAPLRQLLKAIPPAEPLLTLAVLTTPLKAPQGLLPWLVVEVATSVVLVSVAPVLVVVAVDANGLAVSMASTWNAMATHGRH